MKSFCYWINYLAIIPYMVDNNITDIIDKKFRFIIIHAVISQVLSSQDWFKYENYRYFPQTFVISVSRFHVKSDPNFRLLCYFRIGFCNRFSSILITIRTQNHDKLLLTLGYHTIALFATHVLSLFTGK